MLVADVVFDPVNASAPSVERRQELAAIHHALTATRGEVAGVVLIGDAGVGKTTLARRAVNSLENVKVRWAVGTESARTVPLGAFADLIVPSALHDPVTFLSAARDSLVSEGPFVLGVDDAHLLDRSRRRCCTGCHRPVRAHRRHDPQPANRCRTRSPHCGRTAT